MDIIGVDLETYYDKKYSLSKISTQEYIDHPLFEVIGVAVKVNEAPAEWFSGTMEETSKWLAQFDWENSWVYAHNALFDATILTWKFGIKPKLWIDTLSMARAVHGTEVGGSLAKLAEHYELGQKGTEVVSAMGVRRVDFSEEELAKYGQYCINDVELTHGLFNHLALHFNKVEIKLIDMTIRMHTEPSFILDLPTLEDHLHHTKRRKEDLLAASGMAKEDLMSNPKFADVLRAHGVVPPMKISPTTGKETYAFAKTDEDMKALLDYPDFDVQAIVAARLGTKSTIEETRTQTFIEIAHANRYLPIPLKYYGADVSGRWSGVSFNMQNIPRTSPIKSAIQAPEGHVIVGADLSNIELRVSLHFSGQLDKLKIIAEGKDLYKDFAASAFKVPYDEVTKDQRFVGKTCIAEGTLVLTNHGEKAIEKVTLEDRVWDGVEWVSHKGVIYQGEKNVITYNGLTATEDHGVFTEQGPIPFGVAASRMETLIRTGASGRAIRVSADYFRQNNPPRKEHLCVRKVYSMWNGEMDKQVFSYSGEDKRVSIMLPNKIKTLRNFRSKVRCHYSPMPKPQKQELPELWRAGDTLRVCLPNGVYSMGRKTFTPQRLQGGRNRQSGQQQRIYKNKFAFSKSAAANTKQTKYCVCGLERCVNSSPAMERKPLHSNVHGSKVCAFRVDRGRHNTTSMGVSAQQAQKLESAKSKARVYDILDAGPRKRFTAGNVLVLNCVLGLGFGTGAVKLRESIRAMSGTDIGAAEAKRIVDLYREEFSEVKNTWTKGGQVLRDMRDNVAATFGTINLPVAGRRGVLLPSGLYLKYPDLKEMRTEAGTEWTYASHRGSRRKIYSGKVVQNTIQALARCIMGEAMVRITKRYKIALTIHDSCYCVVPEDEAQEALDFIITELCKEPTWMPGIPLGAEGAFGRTLKEAG